MNMQTQLGPRRPRTFSRLQIVLWVIIFGVLGALVAALATAPPADAGAPTCTPSDAWVEVVVDTPAIDRWYTWTGGPSDTHPFPNEAWQPDNGNHAGFPQTPGVYQRDKGHSGQSDWFYHQVVPAVTHDVVHPAVTCPTPTPTPTWTPTPTPTPTVTPTPTPSVTPTPTPSVVTPTPTPTTTLGPTPTGSAPHPTATPVSAIGTVDTLAETGISGESMFWLALVALGFLGSGAAMWVSAERKKAGRR